MDRFRAFCTLGYGRDLALSLGLVCNVPLQLSEVLPTWSRLEAIQVLLSLQGFRQASKVDSNWLNRLPFNEHGRIHDRPRIFQRDFTERCNARRDTYTVGKRLLWRPNALQILEHLKTLRPQHSSTPIAQK